MNVLDFLDDSPRRNKFSGYDDQYVQASYETQNYGTQTMDMFASENDVTSLKYAI